jgi:hypothetical protein
MDKVFCIGKKDTGVKLRGSSHVAVITDTYHR